MGGLQVLRLVTGTARLAQSGGATALQADGWGFKSLGGYMSNVDDLDRIAFWASVKYDPACHVWLLFMGLTLLAIFGSNKEVNDVLGA